MRKKVKKDRKPENIQKQRKLDVSISNENDGILIVSASGRAAAIKAAIQDAFARYAETFRRLAE